MATAATSSKRQPRKKKAEQKKETTIALPALADEHLDIPTLETWLWDAACAIRGAADVPRLKDFILPDTFPGAAVWGTLEWKAWLVLAVEPGGMYQ